MHFHLSSLHNTDEICQVYCNFSPGFACQTTESFGMRDKSLNTSHTQVFDIFGRVINNDP